MWGRDFDWYHFPPHRSKLAPQMGVELGGGSKLGIGITAKLRQIEQNFVLRGRLGSRVRSFQPAKTPLSPKIGDLKTPHLHYGQTVADGATL